MHYKDKDGTPATLRARCVIGADGALSKVARDTVRGAEKMPYVFAYHEIVASPGHGTAEFAADRCDVYYKGTNVAYGYAITGGMSQYGLIGSELLDGDGLGVRRGGLRVG